MSAALQSAAAMKLKADDIAINRARLNGVMRLIHDQCGRNGLRAIIQTEFERVTGANDNTGGSWIG